MPTTQHLTTEHTWKDLVLNESAFQSLAKLFDNAKQKQSCNALFYGPAGTGKTLAATLLGKELGNDVVRVDLAGLVSKYIGETEKNLRELFSRAESKNWILLFDEADALFGKRTTVKDSHDKYANQEISYLTQRVNEYNGIVLFASNRKSNIDEAFLRRLKYVIHFAIPGPAERLVLWQRGLIKNNLSIDGSDLREIANNFELSGAAILKVTRQLGQGSGENNAELILSNIIANASNKK
ncbi:MAG: ATP-binding protein [Chitinophagaceae bacterium]|nr:ATP-binding protein [Chitinophagaceae bacterium]